MANFFISIYVSNYLKNRRYNDAKIKTIPTLKAKRRRKWFLKKKISERTIIPIIKRSIKNLLIVKFTILSFEMS